MSSDDKGDNIASLVDRLPPDKLKAAIQGLKDSEADMIEFQQYAARLHRAKFVALIEAGFTSDQALELCKKTSI